MSFRASLQWPLFGCLLWLLVFSHMRIRSLYRLPFPHFQDLVMERGGLEDVVTILAGFRAVAADIAWVQFLQRMSNEEVLEEDPQKTFPFLKQDVSRIVRIDPRFHRAYLYGAGILAWFKSVNRPQEALEILEEGIRNNPNYWMFRNYVGAIIYKRKEDFPKAAALLEDAVRQPDCPGITKAILANIYKGMGEYRKAIRTWEAVLEDPQNSDYHPRARSQIAELERLLGRRPTPS